MSYLDRFWFWWSGQGYGLIKSVKLAREIDSQLFYEFYSFNKERSAHHEKA